MQTVLAGGAGLSLAPLASAASFGAAEAAEPKLTDRHVELLNTHTGETVSVVYRRGQEYVAPALASLANLLRDHRNNERHKIDARLFDQLHGLALAAHCDPRFEIISGYRSAESNDKMSSRPGSGVAKKSLHMQGRALDIRLKNCPCTSLRDLALAAKQGGVGYYRRSDFVHIDTGAFRTWIG
jgi:uncharacterized protein YcbK (DUF882 family)